MHPSPAFRENRPEVLQALIKHYPFATLLTQTNAGLAADHLPFILKTDTEQQFGTLYGHVAKANTVWENFSTDVDALVVFQGPHDYISPNWYPSKKEHGKVVPTWNYAIVHAYGSITVKQDDQWLTDQLNALTNQQEKTQAEPWSVSDTPKPFLAQQLKGIVGIEIQLNNLYGIWKLSQNKNKADKLGVIQGLNNAPSPTGDSVSLRVQEHLD